MSEIHQIGELLRNGVAPSKEEVEHLSELGAFVTAMYGRYLHGSAAREGLGSGSDTFASALGARLGAETSTRWEQGLGLSEQLLSSEWGGWWQVAARGFGSGYEGQAFDWDRSTLDLYEDAPRFHAAQQESAPRARRGSLFGKRSPVSGGRRAAATRPGVKSPIRPARPTRPPGQPAQWVDGGFVELAALAALESGGLFLADQLLPAQAPQRADVRPAAEGQRSVRRRPATLDGLLVDDRTPALSSALAWAEAAFGASSQQLGLAVNTQRIDAMTSVGASAVASQRGGERPVYGFYDAVEGDFLTLGAEEAAAGVAPATVQGAAPAARPSLFAEAARSMAAPARSMAAPARPMAAQAAATRGATTSTAPIATSLSRITTEGRQLGHVRPYTAGVFSESPQVFTQPRAAERAPAAAWGAATPPPATTTSTPARGSGVAAPGMSGPWSATSGALSVFSGAPEALRFASQVTYTRGGQPQARVQRGGSAAPRVSLLSLGGLGPAQAVELDDRRTPIGASDAISMARPVPGADPARLTPVTPAALTPATPAALTRVTTSGAFATAPAWRTAADLGPDLPLGATLTRPELFGLFATLSPASPTMLGRQDFVPQIAREPGTTATTAPSATSFAASPFASASFSAIDGVVWVAPESGDPRTAVEAATDRMPLSAVPRGRSAAMMPVGQALQVAARGAMGAATGRETAIGRLLGSLAGGRAETLGTSPQSFGADLGTGTRTGFGAGAFASFETAREFLSLVTDAAPTVEGAPSVRTPARPGEARPRLLAAHGAAAQSPQALRAALRSIRPGADPASKPGARGVMTQGAAAARNALRRPVATAREAWTVAPLLAILGRGDSATAQGFAAERSLEPVLSQRIAIANEARADVLATDAGWSSPAGLLDAVSRLGAAEGRAVMRTLADAGWTASDLQMLNLGSEGLVDATTAQSAPVDRREATARLKAVAASARAMIADSGTDVSPLLRSLATDATALGGEALTGPAIGRPDVFTAPVAERATAANLGRNLARIIGGAEALGAPVSAAQVGGGILASTANAQATGFMPMLAGARADGYFGAAAPDRAPAVSSGYTGLRDAIGELVSIAQELARTADTTVESSARQETFRRLVESRGAVDRSRPAARDATAQVLAAGSNDKELARVLSSIAGGERVQAVALARRIAPATVARLERSLSGTALAELGLVDTMMGSKAPVLGADVANVVSAAEVTRPSLAALLGAGDHTLVAQEAREPGQPPVLESASGETRAIARLARLGLGGRVNEALRASTLGPAGARRLLRPVAGIATTTADSQAKGALRAAGGGEGRAPLDLASVIAPEAMLTGLRAPEVTRAMSALATAQGSRGEAPGVFATLADSGVELGVGGAPVDRGRGAEVGRRGARAEAREAGRREAALARIAGDGGRGGAGAINFFKSDPVHVLMQLVERAGGEAVGRALGGGGEAGFGRRGRAGLLSAMMRGADRREVASLFQQAGASDFAFAWLARVDGTKSGIDLGLGDTRADMGRAFGSRRVESRVAGESPIAGAGLVGPAASPGRDDRSGLRSLVAHAPTTRTGAARSQHGASAAVRRTDWRFVETGSRAPTAHADLGKLASAIVSGSQAASRAPLPLIAPAAKAVAQTALRSGATEARPASTSRAKAPGGGAQTPPPKQTLSEEAMEQLAIEMASRVAQIMGRNKERIGVWQ